jgi:ribosomal protein S18 acetylase RimI-like enzyme
MLAAMGLQIRSATPADAKALAELQLASYRAAYQGLLPAAVLASLRAEDREQRWQASLNDPQRHTLIAADGEAGSAPIGFAEVGPSRDDDAEAGTGELIALHVAQAQWRRGLGRTLTRMAMATLAADGYSAATLWVLTGNSRARAFYQAMSWHHDGTAREFPAWGSRIPEVRYRTAWQFLGQQRANLNLPDGLALLGLEHVFGPAGGPVARQRQQVTVAEPGFEGRADRFH